MPQSINNMDKLFLRSLKPDNIHWEHGTFPNQKCDSADDFMCKFQVEHSCLSDYSADADVVKSLCDMHYNKITQKRWLARFKSNLNP